MLPHVIIHNAVSLDGRIDCFKADVTRFYELAGRWKEDATLAGSETMLHPAEDVPPEDESVFKVELKVEKEYEVDDERPMLVVVDSKGQVRNWHFWKKQPYWRDFIAVCSQTTPKDYLEYLTQRHIKYIIAGEDRVDLRKALEELHERFEVSKVRVESGGVLNGVLLREGLVNEVSLLVHPDLVGGTSPRSFFRAPDLPSSEGVIRLKLVQTERFPGDILWLRYQVIK